MRLTCDEPSIALFVSNIFIIYSSEELGYTIQLKKRN